MAATASSRGGSWQLPPPAGSVKHTPGGGTRPGYRGLVVLSDLGAPSEQAPGPKGALGTPKAAPHSGTPAGGGRPRFKMCSWLCFPQALPPVPPRPISPFEAPGSILPEMPQKRLLWAPPGRRKNLFTSFSPPFHSFHPSLTCGRCRREKSARHRVPTAPLHYGVLGSQPGQGAAAPNSLLCFL